MTEHHSKTINGPNAEKTYSFTQETFSECSAHARCVLEATLPRENKIICTRTVRLTTDFSRANRKVRDRSPLFETERGLRKQPLLKNIASSFWALEVRRSRTPALPAPIPCIHLLYFGPFSCLNLYMFSTQDAVLAFTDLTFKPVTASSRLKT